MGRFDMILLCTMQKYVFPNSPYLRSASRSCRMLSNCNKKKH
jgi:hypothetical protein